MSLEYIRDYYKVPAQVGRRVSFEGREGVITGAKNQYIMIHFDGDKKPRGPFHPTCGITYLGMGEVPKMSRSAQRYARYREVADVFNSFRHFLLYEKRERLAAKLGFADVGELSRWEATV